MVGYLIDYGGQRRRAMDLFGNQSPMSMTKKFFKGLKGVENIYTQHNTLLSEILDDLVKGRLKESQYPFLTASEMRER